MYRVWSLQGLHRSEVSFGVLGFRGLLVHVGQGAHGLAVFRLGGALSLSHSARGMLSGNFRTCSEALSGTVLSDESLAQSSLDSGP